MQAVQPPLSSLHSKLLTAQLSEPVKLKLTFAPLTASGVPVRAVSGGVVSGVTVTASVAWADESPLSVTINVKVEVVASQLAATLAVMLPLVGVVKTAPPLSIVMAPVVPPPAVPVSWIAAFAAVMFDEVPVTNIPSLAEEPVADPVPFRVIGAVLVEVIAPAADTRMPWFVVPVPLPVPVKLMEPVADVIKLLVPSTKIP